MSTVDPDPQQDDAADYHVRNYQDDLDTDPKPDKITQQETDDPTEELGVNPNEFRDELNKYAFDEKGMGSRKSDENYDDERERIEDLDEEMQSPPGDASAQP